ncbi:unnamed protein product [Paramecium sonneborni]|uniref:Uncharacterized protein n=1 Tax=Paramecium sonneborni TaxID=65129 RepID=A0A8S1K4X3_9CILI|nr:unnamed protein product [Paramecium sonneborni]
MIQEINLSQEISNDQKVMLIIDKKILDLTLKFIKNLNKSTMQISDIGTFKRRVVPFFMNQFYHWAINRKLKQVVNYLKQLKKNKESQQKKFELGDLKELFTNKETAISSDNIIKDQTRESWKEFLKNYAVQSVLRNQKIKCMDTKQNYIKYIPILIEELDQMFPYDKLLSKYKLPSVLPGFINFEEMIQYESNPQYSTNENFL